MFVQLDYEMIVNCLFGAFNYLNYLQLIMKIIVEYITTQYAVLSTSDFSNQLETF